jgi:hypothetical protein
LVHHHLQHTNRLHVQVILLEDQRYLQPLHLVEDQHRSQLHPQPLNHQHLPHQILPIMLLLPYQIFK